MQNALAYRGSGGVVEGRGVGVGVGGGVALENAFAWQSRVN